MFNFHDGHVSLLLSLFGPRDGTCNQDGGGAGEHAFAEVVESVRCTRLHALVNFIILMAYRNIMKNFNSTFFNKLYGARQSCN